MGGSGSGGGSEGSSSSGEEDGDAHWREAIESVAAAGMSASDGAARPRPNSGGSTQNERAKKEGSRGLKLYQVKAQKLLDDLVGNSLEIVRNPIPCLADSQSNEGGIRLFSKAPPGILDPVDLHPQPRKRPKILPGEEFDEKSKKFWRRLRSVAVDGVDIMAAAKDACQKSLSKFEAKNAAAIVAAKREEERVAELKKVRGEKWLPSLAREMQGKVQRQI